MSTGLKFVLPETIGRGRPQMLCGWCGVQFQAKKSNQKFCCNDCRFANFYVKNMQVKCPNCKEVCQAIDNRIKNNNFTYEDGGR